MCNEHIPGTAPRARAIPCRQNWGTEVTGGAWTGGPRRSLIMRTSSTVRALLLVMVLAPSAIAAQSSQLVSSAAVPRLIEVTGVFRPADGLPAGPTETVTLSIYADPEGGVPVWQE